MTNWNCKQLVVDASVAAGSNDQMFNPAGEKSGDRNRSCLQAVWDEKHFAVFNEQLRLEWRKHASPFAVSWLQKMVQKNRVIVEEGGRLGGLLKPICDCQSSEGHKEAIKKDFHLIRSALASGQLIVSNEVRLPRHIATACDSVRELLLLHYGSPAVEGEVCRLWIKAGAEKRTDRRIDNWVITNCADH
jgi:hypothetical protein